MPHVHIAQHNLYERQTHTLYPVTYAIISRSDLMPSEKNTNPNTCKPFVTTVYSPGGLRDDNAEQVFVPAIPCFYACNFMRHWFYSTPLR